MLQDSDIFRENNFQETSGTEMSIGDLMSGLLMIFILLFIVTLLKLQQYVESQGRNRIVVIQALQEQLNLANIAAEVDEETGDLSIMESVLFDEGQSKLKPEGRAFLDTFIPVYSQVIYSKKSSENMEVDIEKEVVRVIVEGYTSSNGSYQANMALSLMRANSVVEYIAMDIHDFTRKADFMGKLMASGRGEIEANQEADNFEDRQVKFRLQFKGEDFKTWAKQLEEAR